MRPAAKLASLVMASAVVLGATFSAAAGAILLSACGSCDSIAVQASVPALAAGVFDGVEADQGGHRLFFADQSINGVDVVDVSGTSPRLVGTIDLPASPNGLAFAAGSKRLYAGMDGGHVAVIDADGLSQTFLKVVDSVDAGAATADLLEFSPRTNSLYVSTGAGASVVAIDAASDKVVNRFDLKTSVEQARYDPADGKLYVTAPHIDSILQLDPAYGTVTRTYRQQGCGPKGLAINTSRQLALVACGGSMAVFNLRTGLDEVSRVVPGGDLVAYDPAVDRFTVGSSHGPRDSSVGVFSGDGRFIGMVGSSPQAHGAVFDDRSGLVYAASKAGLLSFSPAACAPPPDWLTFIGGASVFIVPLVLFGLYLFAYARRHSRIGTRATGRASWDQLQREDLAAERERIRELEDAIYGPEGG
jgi:DNA-binding beta-propeller fold protein YncE